MVDLLIKDGYIITMDKQRRIFTQGSIAIEKNRILDIGKTNEMKKKYRANRELDAKGKAILPGLVNAHGHFNLILYRGLGDDQPLLDWVFKFMLSLGKNTTKEDSYIGALLACVEMIKSGTTCAFDFQHYYLDHAEASAQAIERTGIRGHVAPGVVDKEYPDWAKMDIEKAIEENTRIIQKWDGAAGGRIHIWLGPITPGANTSTELLIELQSLANHHGVGITGHLAEVPERVNKIRTEYGYRGHVEYLYNIGLLGPRFLAAHCIWISNEEIQLLKNTNTKVVHNPGANMYLADGIAPVPRLTRAGVTVALGTDGASSNNNLDMFEEMRLATILHKVSELNPVAMTAQKALEMATIDGARALGVDKEIGSLEQGKKADIILVNLESPHMIPIHNVVGNLVYCANGSDVDTVIVDGEVVMEDRKLNTVEEDEVVDAAKKAAAGIVERTSLSVR